MGTKMLRSNISLTVLFMLMITSLQAQLVPQFSATPLNGCAPLVVNFTDQSTGGATQWKWDLGNSTVSFLQNPSATYFNPGTYSVKLVVTNAAGDKDSITKTQYITVFALPTVNFTGTPTTGCFPLNVQFNDASTAGSGTITNWLWDFGDGNTSTASNPSHIYLAAGNFNVSVRITNSNGCTKTLTKTNYITISSGVNAVFTNNAATGCSPPQTINFQNQSTGTGTLSYQWFFGDGGSSTNTNPSHTYTAPGSYTVQLIVTNSSGCTDTTTHPNAVVIGTVSADFTAPISACVGTAISITNTSMPTPISVQWDFGDATNSTAVNPIKTYTTPGNYTITLVSNFGGCTATQSKPITVFAKPATAFSGSPLTSCSAPLTVNFTNNTPGTVTSQWLFGDGGTDATNNPSYTYTATGSYTVTLITTNTNGCTDTLIKTNYVIIQPPVATITNLPKTGCAPLTNTFSSTVSSIDPIVSYEWNFGDGSPVSNAVNPTHTFATGSYNIQLIVTTAGGCTDTVVVPQGIIASTKPTANFIANPPSVCAMFPVDFLDQSTGTITSWIWNFGDGGSSSTQNPNHSYQDTGFFSVTLIVSNNGCNDTLTLTDYVYIKAPIGAFNIANDCNNKYTKTFIDASIAADTWMWDFGDGSTSTQQNPVHTYAAVGTYTITQTTHNNSTGCDYIKMGSVIVADEQAAFTATITELCKNGATTFIATSTQAFPAISNYEWDFGDGTTTTGNNATHTYLAAGFYDVQLIITDVNNCKDTLKKLQYIRVNGPLAAFTPNSIGTCPASSVVFLDQSTTDGIHPITTWYWNYGDGILDTLSAPPFQHTYNNTGVYSVSLVVQDSYGCKDSLFKLNLITIATPSAMFFSNDTASCPNKPIKFFNQSIGNSITYLWTFGDGGTSTQIEPTHNYLADGNYTVTLKVTDLYGCTNTFTRLQYVKINTPIANFTTNNTTSTCPPLIVQFTNTSSFQQSFVWDFGDGAGTTTEPNPQHFYNVAGNYTAKLTVTSAGGCVSIKTLQITVRGPSGTFTYTPISGCSILNVTFTATTMDRASFVWDFNDGTTLTTTDSIVSHPYNIPGIYVPKMILKDAAGCTVPIDGIDTIKVSGVQAAFVADTLLRCSNGFVTFTNNTTSNDVITGYVWDFGDGTTSTDPAPTHFYAAPGLYYVKLTSNTQSGCTHTATAQLPVKVVLTPDVSITQTANGCAPLSATFSGNLLNGDTSAIKWLWKFSNNRLDTGQTLQPFVYTTAGIYQDTLTAVNSSGCMDTAYSSIEVFAQPNVVASNDISICENAGQTISVTGANTYTWSPAAGLSCTTCDMPIATPDSVTKYFVTGTSVNNCTKVDSIIVRVNYPFKMMAGPTDTLCLGETAILKVSGAATYMWSPTASLNVSTGPTVIAKPTTVGVTTYTAVGFDDKNCFTDTVRFAVKVNALPTVNAGTDKTINVGQTIVLTPIISADVVNVMWTPSTWVVGFNSPSLTVKPNLPTEYKATVTNAGGCKASSLVNVFVLCNNANVFIPNTFSPNGDGMNEVFYPRGTGLFTIKQARIFDRWGEEVFAKYSFKANDATAGWDGTFKGQKLQADVFVYYIEIQCDNNSTLVYKGNVTLIR